VAVKLNFHTVDVFTNRRFSGNQLAIVEDADALATAQMQTIAREFNLSETIFIQRPANPEHTAKVRIFFPTDEIPFAGHPTIGCAIHLAQKAFPGSNDFETIITLEEVAGLVPVEVVRKSGTIRARLTAPVVPFAAAGRAPDTATAARALGLEPSQIGLPGHQAALWQGGPTFLFIPLANRAALSAARAIEPSWTRMLADAGTDGAFLYTSDPGGATNTLHTRMFAPGAGIPEDPATGSASALLAAQLLDCGELAEGLNAFTLHQGYDMGRPSDIGLEADVVNGRLAAVRIEGSSVAVMSGKIAIAD
jgi:trans-2,3-dihydro-3-hydroxyanthranilate isomerase